MKAHGVQAVGSLKVPRYPTLPTWTSADEGRLIYTEDEDKLYYGTSSQWTEGSGESNPVSSGSGGVDYIEIKPSSIYIDDIMDGLVGGNIFNLLPSYNFSPTSNGAIFFDFIIPSMWYLDVDVIFDLYFSLEGGSIGQNIKLKTDFWFVKQGDIESETSPTETGYDSIFVNSNMQDIFYKTTLTGSKFSSFNRINTVKPTVTVKITRLAEDTLDTFDGIFKLAKIIVRQADKESYVKLLSTDTVMNKTSDYDLLQTDSGKTFTNIGITIPQIYKLPFAEVGLYHEFVKCEIFDLTVVCKSGDLFDNQINGRYDHTNGLKNGSLRVECFQPGIWTQTCKVGDWCAPGDRGIMFNGSNIAYFSILTSDIALLFGSLTVNRTTSGSCSNGSNNRGICAAGGNGSTMYSTIDYITISNLGNAIAFGNVTVARHYISGTSNGINNRGVFSGGTIYDGVPNYSTIDYINISTTGNASSFGSLTFGRRGFNSVSNSIRNRAINFGGQYSAGGGSYPHVNIIDYITITTPSNALDFGDLTVNRGFGSAMSNGINDRGVSCSGGNVNVIDYVTISTIGNALDFGDTVVATNSQLYGTSNGINQRGRFQSSGGNHEILTISTLGNSLLFGSINTYGGSMTSNA